MLLIYIKVTISLDSDLFSSLNEEKLVLPRKAIFSSDAFLPLFAKGLKIKIFSLKLLKMQDTIISCYSLIYCIFLEEKLY